MAGDPWTESDIAILAQEYFAVLDAEALGQPVNKSDALRRAQETLPTERSFQTLKDRCARISEELWKRDRPWVQGWKPPKLVGQHPNSANVSAKIWAAIESLGRAEKSEGVRRPGVARGLTGEQVMSALIEWRRLGRDDFLSRYGGAPAQKYLVIAETGEVDALALLLGARALAGMDTSGRWRGDHENVAEPLRALGFRVENGPRKPTPEAKAVEDVLEAAAGRAARQGGQGFQVDQASKRAVEAHAMADAKAHYERLGAVTETAATKSWDYEVDIAGAVWHIEVKGTTGDPVDVILTPNEVAHAQTYEHVALYVVSNIEVRTDTGPERTTSGGLVTLLHPWVIEQGVLQPVGFKYRLPEAAGTNARDDV